MGLKNSLEISFLDGIANFYVKHIQRAISTIVQNKTNYIMVFDTKIELV